MRIHHVMIAGLLVTALPAVAQPAAAPGGVHNVVIFVADGLRSRSVNDESAPNMAALARQGVYLLNGHSLFPTLTMANASGIATGHHLGDTGVFSNTLYAGYGVASAGGSVTPFIENDAVLGDLDAHFAGNFVNEDTILKLARDKGYSTAAIGKIGPALMFDHTGRADPASIVIDDATGTGRGILLSPELTERLASAGLPTTAPGRGDNAKAGSIAAPGTKVANVGQQDYFAAVATRVVLPLFAARNKPFVLVFWSRDPDGTQHNQGDSFQKLTPGINGPTSLAAIRNADDDLGRLRAALAELGLAHDTDVVVTADHGFSTISKESASSPAAKAHYADVPPGMLPPGFLAIDLAKTFDLPLLDPDNGYALVADGSHSRGGNALIGGDKDHPRIVVAANGGSDLIYVPDSDKGIAARIVDTLLAQDYVSGIFVDGSLGKYPGTLSLADISLDGAAATPRPAILVNFRSFDTVCGEPVRCAATVSDTGLQQGQGMHGSFSRADTWNFMALSGPDFKTGFVDIAPASNADIGRTVASLLRLDTKDKGKLAGRVLEETMLGGAMPDVTSRSVASDPAGNGLRTVVSMQQVGDIRYFDAAGFPGRTVGLSQPTAMPGPR